MSSSDDTTSPSEPPTDLVSPFMNLPTELHILIANYLIFPDIIHLKLTCAYFNHLIPPLSHRELLDAELTDFAWDHDLYACRYCLRFRPAAKFADRMLRRRRRRCGRDAVKRFCVDCGLMPRRGAARYGPGAHIRIQGHLFVICMVCRNFTYAMLDRHKNGMKVCADCWDERLKRQEHLYGEVLGDLSSAYGCPSD
ncbi:hypothetical protein BDV23DRAFT_39964 [Aspergillus alliaceus]|uniref:Uncharacterized protein n=1 Tax=Petromyces alliaceus TaxID=209559 RepID=A0A5N6FTE7_PETAA|nr:uncharacterized protein BDW43DRAFT_109666 [Aspergillus alliaceus]KAB8232465.1 hypothetical protein BDW43DRAFT_109666 [Aspergillus alliaceus]KAE8393398.1 hypothetical protein BDV23DRAFT_39964 [Aspergillus alliaceus]